MLGIGVAIGLELPMPDSDGDCDTDSDPDNAFPAALSGSQVKATGFSGEYLVNCNQAAALQSALRAQSCKNPKSPDY